MGFERFAVFHVPPAEAEWARVCTGWLGWDSEARTAAPAPDLPDLPLPLAEITRAPRRYGLHATIKPPFRLAPGANPAQLAEGLGTICARLAPVSLPSLTIARIGGFLALCPPFAPPGLADLHAEVLRGMDGFRAPPAPEETARRSHARLSPRQRAHLARWGYPHVLEDFRFHLTLTGRLPAPALAEVRAVLDPALAPLLAGPLEIRDLALMGEDSQGRFHLLERLPLSG